MPGLRIEPQIFCEPTPITDVVTGYLHPIQNAANETICHPAEKHRHSESDDRFLPRKPPKDQANAQEPDTKN
jgi:hypothetical protein